MKLERYEQIQQGGGFIAKTLRRHVENVATRQYRKMVLNAELPVNQSVDDTTAVVRRLVSSYIVEVLPDEVDYKNIGLFT